MTAPSFSTLPPLDPDLVRLVRAMAKEAARRDHLAENPPPALEASPAVGKAKAA